jgi:hypothetical protein
MNRLLLLSKKCEEFINTKVARNTISGSRIIGAKRINYTHPTENIQTYKDNLIKYINKYSDEFDLNANFVAALIYAESKYILYNISPTGALGLGQFVPTSGLKDVLVRLKNNLTDDEYHKITNGLSIQPNSWNNNNVSNLDRIILLKNMADNYDITIKMVCIYLNFCSNFGSNNRNLIKTIVAYNAGIGMIKPTVQETINTVITHYRGIGNNNKITEVSNYINRIINLIEVDFDIYLKN